MIDFICKVCKADALWRNEYQSLMNNTKWEEIRLAMYNYPSTIQWRVKNIDNGYISNWDAEWFYHFRLDEYDTIEWLEMKVHNEEMKNNIINILRKIHVLVQNY